MKIAEIITQWIGAGADDNPNRPKIKDDYSVLGFEDVTGQPAINLPLDQNMFIAKVTAEDSVFSEIELDDNYFVLWSEEIVNGEQI